MKKKIVAVVALASLAVLFLMLRSGLRQKDLIIVNATVISPERAAKLQNAFVKIKDGRIEAVGEMTSDLQMSGYDAYDAGGRYVIPGLIDSHVHLSVIPGVIDPVLERLPAQKKAALERAIGEYVKQLPRSYLFYGYTTLVDLNVVDRAFIEEMKKAPAHPDIFDCDGGLMVANGYPMQFSSPEKKFVWNRNFIYDPLQKDEIPPEYNAEDHSPAAGVRRVKAAGGICIKTFYEDGFGPRKDWPVPTLDMVKDIVAEGKKVGLPTLIHANSFASQRFAVDAGADVIVHGMWSWDEYSTSDELPDAIKGVLDGIVLKRIGYMPTYRALGGMQDMYDPDFLKMQRLDDVMPVDMLSWFESDEGRWFADSLEEEEGLDAAGMRSSFDAPLHKLDQVVAYLNGKGARFLFGTDTPASPAFGNPPGLNGYLEMVRWSKAGIPLPEILRAATIDNAAALDIDRDYGTIEPGKIANLVVMDRDPLESVEAYDSISSVVLHGKMIKRTGLVVSQVK